MTGFRIATVETWLDRDKLPPELVDEIAQAARSNLAVIKWRSELIAALQLRNSVAVVELLREVLTDTAADMSRSDLPEVHTRATGALALVAADLADDMSACSDPTLWAQADEIAGELIAGRRVRDVIHTNPTLWALLHAQWPSLGDALADLFTAAGERPPEVSP